ncbi:ABC transporter substrate-binding protein [Variovorax sp. LARHSF232]
MKKHPLRSAGAYCAALWLGLTTLGAAAAPQYDPGASATEIRLGNIAPYSGPASSFSVASKTEAAYFRMINEQGGINGRKITFISYDDGALPPKAVEQTRKLVESDNVLLVFQSLGTASNSAIQPYLNGKKVPQLFVGTGATRFGDPKKFPWSMNWPPSYEIEGYIYAKYILETHGSAKVAVLYQNDDFGKDILRGLKEGLGTQSAAKIVAQEPYEVSDPTVDSRVLALKASGADVVVNAATPKFAAQAIRKMSDIGWSPVHLVTSVANSVGSVMTPAGLANSKGILSASYMKDPTDVTWASDAAQKEWEGFLQKYYPDADRTNNMTVYGYLAAQLMVQVLKQSGDNLTRRNIMDQAASIKDLKLGMLLPGISLNTSPTNFSPVNQMQMMRFDSTRWQMFGPVISATETAKK